MSMIEQVFIKEEVYIEGDEDEEDEDELHSTPDVLELENDEKVESQPVPQYSKTLYWNVYNIFMEWMESKKKTVITEDLVLAYFVELSKKYKPPSLWSKYSMLRSTVKVKHNIDIHDFTKLLNYLKEENRGYEPKKSEILNVDDVKKFLSDAPDDEYLAIKVALIIALFGGCRHCDLVKLSNKDVEEHGQIMKITLRNRGNNSIKTFVIEGEMLQPIKAYRALRPKNATEDRFFLNYKNGKCTNLPLGKNKFGSMPKEIAQFLELPNPELYTGHSFRRSSATLCKERGISVADLKRLSGFRKSTPVAEKSTQQPNNHNKQTFKRINCLIPGTSQKYLILQPVIKRPKLDETSSKLNANTKTVLKLPSLNATSSKLNANPKTVLKLASFSKTSSKLSANTRTAPKLPSLSDKLTLYSYWRSSCSYRVRIALNLKEIPYDLKTINLEKGGGEQHSDEFRKINPMARVPALHIDNHTLIESLNILQYLEETRPQHPLLPADPLKRARVREICETIASGIQPLQNIGVFAHLLDEQKKDWAQFWITRGFLAVEEMLASRAGKYCIGDDITLADCCLVPQVYNARKFRVDLKPFPRIAQIDQNLESHPAFVAAHPNNQPDCPTRKEK